MSRTLHPSGARRSLRLLALGLVAVAMVVPVAADETDAGAAGLIPEAVEPDPLEGRPIVRIVFIRRDIFDLENPDTDSWPYRWANALHVVSTEDFIRSMLLFTEGDPYHRYEAEESARILRGLDIINPVVITASEVEGGVEVVVDTHDQWSLEIGAKFGLFGSRSDWAVSFDEENLLGRGLYLSLKYRSDDERNSLTYGVYDPNILGTRWRGRLEHEEATDGDRQLARFDYPFYSLETRWAGGVEWLDDEETTYLYDRSESVVSGTSLRRSLWLWGGMRLPGPRHDTRRLSLGYHHMHERYRGWEEEDGDDFADPVGMKIGGPRLQFQRVVDRFVVLHGFRAWRSQEDVGLGPNLDLGLTLSLPGLGGDEWRVLLDGRAERVWSFDNWLLLGELEFAGRVQDAGLVDGVVSAQLAASQLGARGFQARVRVTASHELDRHRQITLGADTGLRGWDPDFFDGTGSAVANLQWRVRLREDVLHLFTLGMVVFADAGYTWGARVGEPMSRVHGDIGVGLVADVTEVGLVKLLRLEVALPDDGSGYTFTITTSHLF